MSTTAGGKESSKVEASTWPEVERYATVSDGKSEGLGSPHEQARKDLSGFNMVAVGFNICNSWVGIASSLAIAISAGGPVTLIYGIIIGFIFYAAVAASLAELASVYPTAGGQYHFTSVLAPEKVRRGLSYTCGVISTVSWTALSAAAAILTSQMILALPVFYVSDYVPKNWHYFLVYQAVNVTFLLYNLFVLRSALWTHNVGFVLTLVAFFVVTITCIARSEKQSSEYVWATFDNATGWPAGVTFLTGLSTPCLGYAGLDAALHLAETCTQPKKSVPRTLMATVVIGFVTAFGFTIAMCYGITDLDALLATVMPIYELWRQACKSSVAATVFLVVLILILFFVVNAVQQTAAHLIWAFGRDRGVVFADKFATFHPKLGVPVWGLLANASLVALAGILYLVSSAAFNALINSCIILQIVSFAIPCILLMVRKRDTTFLPEDRSFYLPNWLGWICNIVVIIAAIIQTVFFDFPGAIPVTGSSMNYTSVVLAIVAVLSGLNWVFYARKHYAGPTIELY